ncbi:uncharacterized protein LOC132551579 [Ylistrum balloti]|uniref:uncharacterized protein LOC132551579 n=1 Tax=Ylistrum balloti TaxID=509963 RepID=UPI002905C550|nr:uncharacterized protein LOC132551579 [Ylistrum balloti]
MSISWTNADVTDELSSPPNPTQGNGSLNFQQDLKHVQSELQDLQVKYNVQQQENSQLHVTVNQLLTSLNQLQATAIQLQTNVAQLQTRISGQNATTSDLENLSMSSTLLHARLDSLESNYNTSVRSLHASVDHIQGKVDELDDFSIGLQTTLLQSEDIQDKALIVQGNVTEFLCEHFTHSNVSVTGNVTAGTAVTRGRDWTYGDQDGHDHVKGVVMDKTTPPGLVYVLWDNGWENIYRVGYAGGYDLYYYYPDVLSNFRHALCVN